MNWKQFFESVGRMRTAQENYLSDRKINNLIKAREAERVVDEVLRNGVDPEPTARVMTFGEYVEQMTEGDVHMDEPTADDVIGDEI
jgi:hypothetical protein